ncbi:MAG: hypothetical protein SVM80_11385 [Halobacteriota archaeon]|nr:hypothetical protein [Halobacteriota archaeon]
MVDEALDSLCVRCMDDHSVSSLKQLQRGCSALAKNMLAANKLVLPTEPKILYKRYSGDGNISFGKTISEFCIHGRNLDNVIGRSRIKTVIKLNIMIIYDDSNSMTGWWRGKRFSSKMKEEGSPQTLAKIASMLVLEGFGKDADVRLITFGSGVRGPFTKSEIIYKELASKNGSGGSRMDLALEKLIRIRWAKEGGVNILAILTDSLPETGWLRRDVPYITETKEQGTTDAYVQQSVDAEVQRRTLRHLKQLMSDEVYILYIPILSDTRLTSWMTGAYCARTFAEELKNIGITIAPVHDASKMPEVVFKGLHELSSNKIVAASDQMY